MPENHPSATSIKQSSIQKKNCETALSGLHSNINKVLQVQILACKEDIYTSPLKDNYMADVNLSCLNVITCLNRSYCKITTTSLKDNATCMTSAYNVNLNGL